jgi:hypothetical protein
MQSCVFNNFSASFLGSFRFVFGSFLTPVIYFQQLLRFVFGKRHFSVPLFEGAFAENCHIAGNDSGSFRIKFVASLIIMRPSPSGSFAP